jgi:hypothetical protein
MRREFVEKIFEKIFPEVKIEIISYTVLERNQLNENNEWVKDLPAIFIDAHYSDKEDDSGIIDTPIGTHPSGFNLSEYLSNFTGHEFSITKV